MLHELSAMINDLMAMFGVDTVEHNWVPQVFVLIFLTLLLHLFVGRVLGRFMHKLERTKTLWDDAFFEAVRAPLGWLIWVGGLTVAVGVIRRESELGVLVYSEKISQVLVILLFSWFVVRFIKQAETMFKLKPDTKMDNSSIHAVAKLLRLSVVITTVLIVLQTLGFSVSGVLAFGGIGGIAIGFAAKDLLANFFGGLMIYMDRPFSVGDWIKSPDKQIEGTVEDIGWRLTRIRTFDKRPLYVPNSIFNTIALENPSRMLNRRIYETFGIRYDDASKMGEIVNDVREMLTAHAEIDQQQTMIVNFNAFAASSLDFFIYTFTKTTNWVHYHEVKQDILLRIVDIVEGHGAEFAFPTSTVHIPGKEEEIEKRLAARLGMRNSGQIQNYGDDDGEGA